ncbi:MAG TPA: hypothetical protein VEX18_03325 [Polyangiaceae bacterium]|nr:hypothetical protein [Polyangiaceae bacterium]
MRSTVIWSFLSLVTLAAGGLISGCDSDAKIRKSAEGESCDGTADCNDGLKCLQGACYKSAAPGGGNEAGEGNGTGGTTSGPPAPVLSGEDESCTKRADCEAGLACFNQRCVTDTTGEGGGGNLPSVRLGALGETCTVTADCEDSLSCMPGGQLSPGLPYGNVGICSRPTAGYAPSGMDCTAECKEAADCCELPLEVHSFLALTYAVSVESCADLDVALTGVNCAADGVTAANQAFCFARDTYCNCDDDTWSCEAGQCVYELSCGAETPGPVLQTDGCPTYSRSGRALFGCNEDLECAPAGGAALCEENEDCDGLLMTDLAVACAEGECTCYQESACYRTCYVDLDCAPGKMCDTDAGVCVPEAQCADDADCGSKVGFGPRFSCIDDMCQLTCASDFECNGGNPPAGINTLVCAPDGLCRPIGCTADSQCSTGVGNTGVKMFCTTPEPVEGGTAVSSAITGGHQP